MWLEGEFTRFQEFITFRLPADLAFGVTAQDGGVPIPSVLAQFDLGVWAAFEREFLTMQSRHGRVKGPWRSVTLPNCTVTPVS